MHYIIIGYILQLSGIFLAFLAVGLALFYSRIIKGGAVEHSAVINAIGLALLALDIFLIYSGVLTQQLTPHGTLLWTLYGLLTFAGFALIYYSQYRLLKVMKR